MADERWARKKRVCIIGGGASGLPSIKACLAEGLAPVCYEQTGDIGGRWNYRPDLPPDQATVMKSTVAKTSKEMMAYSDFPCPDHFPNFMHNGYVTRYLKAYAERFGLHEYIRLNTKVEKVRRSEEGRWTVALSTGETERFDAVMICVGHHAQRSTAPLDGLADAFGGRVLHSQQYGDPSGFERRRVLVVGVGDSALDAAVELSRVAAKVFVSTRRGTWVTPRVSRQGLPFDVNYLTRFHRHVSNLVPSSLINDYYEYTLNLRMNHELYGLKPAHRFFEQQPAVNDQLPNCLATGAITLKADVKCFDKSGVTFADESREQVDTVLVCSGYNIDYPFLEPASLLPVEDNRVDLYKLVFAPDAPDSSLVVVGLVQSIGAVQPIGELQARWAARVFAGRARTPTADEQRAEIRRRRAAMRRRFFDCPKHTVQVDCVDYMDEIAKELGALPDVARRVLLDPALGLRLFFGPNLPFAYRLDGPHAWTGARDAVLDSKRRMVAPLRSRQPWPQETAYFIDWRAVEAVDVVRLTIAAALFAGCYALLGAPNLLGYVLWLGLFIGGWGVWLMWLNVHYDFGTLV